MDKSGYAIIPMDEYLAMIKENAELRKKNDEMKTSAEYLTKTIHDLINCNGCECR